MTAITRRQRKKEDLSAERVRELLAYDPETGTLTWRVRRRRVAAGGVAGSLSRNGYIQIFVAGSSYLAHRIVWLLHHGRWPALQLDHINGDRADNRLDNLREATRAENQFNRRRKRRNASGFRSVRRIGERFAARIRINGQTIYLGTFRLPEVAFEVYAQAAREHFGAFAPHDQLDDPWD